MINKLKNVKRLKLITPNTIRLSFYMAPINENQENARFTAKELDGITLLDFDSIITCDLFESGQEEYFDNIYSLMDEGVLSNQPTGADLGIYDYQPIYDKKNVYDFDYKAYIGSNFVQNIEDYETGKKVSLKRYDDNNDWSKCVLAESDFAGEGSKVIRTFKGYLEISKTRSVIRKCDCVDSQFTVVDIPQECIYRYQLRNGDEILCSCNEDGDKMVLNTLFTINGISCYDWVVDRPWLKNMNLSGIDVLNINQSGYLNDISNKFGLRLGDSVCLYLNRTSQKQQVLSQLIGELSAVFDKVVYINPQGNNVFAPKESNVIKFCALNSERIECQINIALLGANHVKRLIEMGKKVAMVVDDINSIRLLDQKFGADSPVAKTILGSVKACGNGASMLFMLVPIKFCTFDSLDSYGVLTNAETLGVVFDNNQVDLFNSYRV